MIGPVQVWGADCRYCHGFVAAEDREYAIEVVAAHLAACAEADERRIERMRQAHLEARIAWCARKRIQHRLYMRVWRARRRAQ